MEVFNILLGAYMEQAGQDVTMHLKEIMRKELLEAGMNIGLFEIAATKESISEQIATNKFDVVICQEALSGVSIGGGTLKEWAAINPHVKVILLIDMEKKKGLKLQNLYNKNNYYDALYAPELSGESLARLMRQSRSKEEAFIYYGLDQIEEVFLSEEEANVEAQPAAGFKAEVEASPVENMVTENVEVSRSEEIETVGAEEVAAATESAMEESFNEALRQMEHYFEATEEVIEKEPEPVERVQGDVVEEVYVEESIFGNKSLFENTMKNRMPEDVETGESIMKEYRETERNFEQQIQTAEQPTSIMVKTGSNMQSALTHVKGQVVEVISDQLLMIRLNEQSVINEENITDYKVTLLIESGLKGRMENGKFKTGVVSLKTYGNCMIDEWHVIVEAYDKDLFTVADQILSKSCNIIMSKM